MYDFYFGSRQDISQDPKRWLLTIKRMLPRWANGVPDSEFLALYDLLCTMEEDAVSIDRNTVLVETGSGATTLVLLYFAIRWNCELYTWDSSGNKLAYLRGVASDTLLRFYSDRNIFNHWKYVAFNSTSEYAGIPMLAEMDKKVAVCFFDSEHTWDTLQAELKAVCPLLISGSIIAIDDGNYNYRHMNIAYLNMIRTKMGLGFVADSAKNRCEPFWVEVENYLKRHFKQVKNLEGGSYRQNYRNDIFWSYYKADRENISPLGMEKIQELEHRFDAWKVYYE